MTPIAERELTYRDDAGAAHQFAVKIHPPQRDGDAWACEYEIGAPASFAGSAFGEDSLQALVMALHAVQAHLNAPDLRGRVSWLGAPLTNFLVLSTP